MGRKKPGGSGGKGEYKPVRRGSLLGNGGKLKGQPRTAESQDD